MDKPQQDKIAAELEATLEDDRLDRKEGKALRKTVAEIANDIEALAFMRNRAFDLASSRIVESPRETLGWLKRVDKIIDNARRPAETAMRRNEPICAFSPGDHCLRIIKDEIDRAKDTLDVCVFTITDDRITERIIQAHRRGVIVRIITDNDKQYDTGSDVAQLREAGIAICFDPDRDHMHHKFALIDQRRMINGSYNWTRGATRNNENILVFADPDLLRQYIAEFDRLWRAFG